MQFDKITEYYDRLMHGVAYDYWVSYLENLLETYDFYPKTILDVCCGTGTVANILNRKGYELTGFDLSHGMIREAKKNYPEIDFYVQNAKNFRIDKTFDLAISLFDSLNYITDKSELQSAFEQVLKHLNHNGMFIFDVNTEYALSNNLFAQINLNPESNPQYIWEPDWDENTKICTVNMQFICKNENGEEEKFTETHIQRAYGIQELNYMLIQAGFDVLNIYSAYRFSKPTKRSDRVFYICRKRD
ncbi:MAG: class I SAM-dependent methyltransferase [Armatimonadetes bacterium]|nr:class I SAM-dependent methyltransferase [Candidatus Hippobium faecium]